MEITSGLTGWQVKNIQHLSHILDSKYISTIQSSPNSTSETPSIGMLHLLIVVVMIRYGSWKQHIWGQQQLIPAGYYLIIYRSW